MQAKPKLKTEFAEITNPATLCRVCLVVAEDHFTNLFHEAPSGQQSSLHEMLQAICAPVFSNSASSDMPEMPARVCRVCRDAIIAAYNLHQQCIETDRRLTELLIFEREFVCSESTEGGQSLNMVEANEDEMPTEDVGDVSKTCSECGKVFARKFTLLRHQKKGVCPGKSNATTLTDPLLGKWKIPKICLDCGKEFERKFSLERHLRKGFCPNKDKVGKQNTVEGNTKTCGQCGKTFARTFTLLRHKRTGSCPGTVPNMSNALQSSNSCPVGDEVSALESGFCSEDKIELEERKPDEVIYGPLMGYENMVMIKVEALDLMDDNENRSSNSAENAIIKTENETAVRHVTDDTKTCSLCSEIVENMSKLKFHMRNCHQSYVCEICDALFPTRHILWYHKLKHKEPNVACPICGKKISSKYNLELHMLRHTGKKMHGCELCSMRFTTPGAKVAHMRIHKKERPFVCDICGKSVVTRASLAKHIMEIHEKIKRFACTVCTRKFATKSHLTCHMLTHTKEKPYKCKLCPQAYSQTTDLVRHVSRAHWSGKPYPCDRCDESFRLIGDLREHYRVHVPSGGGLDEMEEVRFNSMAIMDKLFAKVKQQQAAENGDLDS